MKPLLAVAVFAVLSACWRGEPPPPTPVATRAIMPPEPAPLRGPCRNGGWGDVEVETMTIREVDDRLVVHGILAFAQRRTRMTLHGPRRGVLHGSMTEIEGLGTVWKIELDLDPDPAGARGQFFEMVSGGERHDMCTFDLRR